MKNSQAIQILATARLPIFGNGLRSFSAVYQVVAIMAVTLRLDITLLCSGIPLTGGNAIVSCGPAPHRRKPCFAMDI